MVHEISVVNGIAEMFYAGDRPWHGLGQQLPEIATAKEAMAAAHLDWFVDKRKMYWEKDNGKMEHSGHSVTVRGDTERPLGIVSPAYKVLQNDEAFDFLDELTGTDEAKYETAGALFHGRKVWALAKLPTTIEVADGDKLEKYILLVNTHDGSESVKVFITPVRVVCNNTLTLAYRSSEVKVRIIHTGNMIEKTEEARRVLGITLHSFDVAEENFKEMATAKAYDRAVKDYFKQVFDQDTPHFEKVRDTLMSLYKEGPTAEIAAGTVWGAYNAITDYVDHYRGHKKVADRHFHSVMMGEGSQIKRKAYENAISFANAMIS